MASVESGTHYESATVVLAGTSKTAILTCPTNHTYYLTGINVCASTGSAGTVDIIHYDGTTDNYRRYHSAVPATGSIDIECRPLVLKAGHSLKAIGAADQHVSVDYMVMRKGDPTGARTS